MTTKDTQRAFEEAVCEIVPRPLFLTNADGSYQEIMVRGFWKLWNAAIEHASQPQKTVSGQGCAFCGNWIGHDLECKNHPVNATPSPSAPVGQLPELPEEIEVGGEGWCWEDFQSEKTFSVDHMLHYGAACAQAAMAEAARQPAPVSQIEHQRDMLAKGIADAALKAGIWNGEVDITGPHLLMFCDDLASAALAATAAPVLSWNELKAITDNSEVHDTLIGFSEDPTLDNAVCVVRAILAAKE